MLRANECVVSSLQLTSGESKQESPRAADAPLWPAHDDHAALPRLASAPYELLERLARHKADLCVRWCTRLARARSVEPVDEVVHPELVGLLRRESI